MFRSIIELERIKDSLSDWYAATNVMNNVELHTYEKEELNNIYAVLSELVENLYVRVRAKREFEKLHEATTGGGTSNE